MTGKRKVVNGVWWCLPAIPALGRWLNQEAPEFKTNIGYMVRL
jgi:hypothetical protein